MFSFRARARPERASLYAILALGLATGLWGIPWTPAGSVWALPWTATNTPKARAIPHSPIRDLCSLSIRHPVFTNDTEVVQDLQAKPLSGRSA